LTASDSSVTRAAHRTPAHRLVNWNAALESGVPDGRKITLEVEVSAIHTDDTP
jgi:hypothetical protein